MDFSEDWKSLFPISASSIPPLLVSGSSTQAVLGPLIFNPDPHSLIHLFSSSSFLPPLHPTPNLSLHRFLVTCHSSDFSSILPSTASSITSNFGSQSQNDFASASLYNRLELLKYPDGKSVVVLFPTGVNSEKVGFFVLRTKDSEWHVQLDSNRDVFQATTGANFCILRILVNPVPDSDLGSQSLMRESSTIGYFFALTLYSINWFLVKHDSVLDRPRVIHLGGKRFTHALVHACWSPHLREESVVLLEDGELFMFDLESHFKTPSSTVNFKGIRLRVPWSHFVRSENNIWLSCEFSWHPRILIVACSDAVYLVDLRLNECNVSCLVKVDVLGMYASVQNEQFLAFSKAGPDKFYFTVASSRFLLLCDVRKPMMPVLRWAHGLDRPCYINVLSLSELRSHSREDTYKLASESGFCIILGSIWNCEFNLFCYGFALPLEKDSVSTKLSRTNTPFCAWDLPSEIVLSGHECHCGSCLLREELSKDTLPEWIDWQLKKEIVLGFGILNDGIATVLCEPDEFGGFSLVRLMSSGRLELQRYHASWVHARNSEGCPKQELYLDRYLLYATGNKEKKFCKKFKFLKLDYFYAYLSGKLTQLMVTKLDKPCMNTQRKESVDAEVHEILCEKLNACGFGLFRSSSAVTAIFKDVNQPASLHEVALRRLWADLPFELLQLAFSNYSEFPGVVGYQNKLALEFLVVPDLLQLPPFFLRNSSPRSNKWSEKVRRNDNIVGPILPLPILLVLQEYYNACLDLEESKYSVEAELSQKYYEVMQMAGDIAVSDYGFELLDDYAVSLADDGEERWARSSKPKSFMSYRSIAFKCSASDLVQGKFIYRDMIYDTLISHVQEKTFLCSEKTESVGQEIFDDLCPVELKFHAPVNKFEHKGLQAYKVLKRQISKWQEGFNPYKEFRNQFSFENEVNK